MEENRKLFDNVPLETSRTIEVMTHSKEIGKYIMENEVEEGGSVNMCEALQGIKEEGKLEGKIQGMIETLQEMGLSREKTLEKVKSKIESSDTSAEEYMEQFWK